MCLLILPAYIIPCPNHQWLNTIHRTNSQCHSLAIKSLHRPVPHSLSSISAPMTLATLVFSRFFKPDILLFILAISPSETVLYSLIKSYLSFKTHSQAFLLCWLFWSKGISSSHHWLTWHHCVQAVFELYTGLPSSLWECEHLSFATHN